MDKLSPGSLLRDQLLEIDEARNARPRVAQQESEMVKERNARLAEQANRLAALRRAREAAGPNPLERLPFEITRIRHAGRSSGIQWL